ncbi:MAG: YtxH domain-containing protein [Bryobacterales bacterium]|nr:YtxH domain-containing protein [Bryobacterales bacterium]
MAACETNGTKTALPYFLTGLGAGMVLAMLLTPRSGPATRSLIGSTVKDGANWVKDKAAVAEDSVRTRGTELRHRVQEAAEVISHGDKATFGSLATRL